MKILDNLMQWLLSMQLYDIGQRRLPGDALPSFLVACPYPDPVPIAQSPLPK
jgi:hypothetical protein